MSRSAEKQRQCRVKSWCRRQSSSASPTHHRPISKIDTQLPEINLDRAGDVELAPAECVQENLNVFLCNDGRVERRKLKDVKDTDSSEIERGVVNGVACLGIRT